MIIEILEIRNKYTFPNYKLNTFDKLIEKDVEECNLVDDISLTGLMIKNKSWVTKT